MRKNISDFLRYIQFEQFKKVYVGNFCTNLKQLCQILYLYALVRRIFKKIENKRYLQNKILHFQIIIEFCFSEVIIFEEFGST